MDSQSPPLWFPPPTNRRRNRVALILVIPIIALILFFLVPPFLSHTNQILRPNSVKKSWDSLNIVLVLFAILCGVFGRLNDEHSPSVDAGSSVSNVSSLENLRPRHSAPTWMYFPDQDYNNITRDVTSGARLRRSSSSYPDLRHESLWESGGGNKYRVLDDFEVNSYRSRSPRSPENSERRPRRRSYEAKRGEVETLVREIPLDKFATPPLKSTAPGPPPPPQPAANSKRRRSVQSVQRREKADRGRDEAEVTISANRRPAPAPPPPHPPPPPPEFELQEVISEKVYGRKSGGATKEIATAIASLYKGQGKRKRRGKGRNISSSSTAAQDSSPPPVKEPQSAPPPAAPPPPPPPPPPSKMLQNLFKKSSKSKRVHSIPTTAPSPPPPPPLPPNSIFNSLIKTVGIKSKRFLQPSPIPPPPPPPSTIRNSRLKKAITGPPPAPPPPPLPQSDPSQRHHLSIGRPPKPSKAKTQDEDDKSFIAPASPLIPLPPPPPPFRMAKPKFVARGDFVRIRSAHSSRCSSPDLEDYDVSGDSIGPSIICPSPDVNVKADTFIERLRGEWKLEKINTVKEKGGILG